MSDTNHEKGVAGATPPSRSAPNQCSAGVDDLTAEQRRVYNSTRISFDVVGMSTGGMVGSGVGKNAAAGVYVGETKSKWQAYVGGEQISEADLYLRLNEPRLWQEFQARAHRSQVALLSGFCLLALGILIFVLWAQNTLQANNSAITPHTDEPNFAGPIFGILTIGASVFPFIYVFGVSRSNLKPLNVVGPLAEDHNKKLVVRIARGERLSGEGVESNADTPASLYAEGCRLSDEGQHAAAVEVFSKCIGADPARADAWHNRGCCLHELGLLSEAIASYSQALLLSPGDSATLFGRGLALEADGDRDGAVGDFEKYLRCSGDVDREKAEYARAAIRRMRT